MNRLQEQPPFLRKWNRLTAVALARLPALRTQWPAVDRRMGRYATTAGNLHARVASAIMIMENARLGEDRLAREFDERLEEVHADEIGSMIEKIADQMNDRRYRSAAVFNDAKISIHSGYSITIAANEKIVHLALSSQDEHPLIDVDVAVTVERRHIMNAEAIVRRVLHRAGDVQAAARVIVIGRSPHDDTNRRYNRHSRGETFPPYSTPVTIEPELGWNHGSHGGIGVIAPRKLIHDQGGPVPEGDEFSSYEMTPFTLVHDVSHGILNVAGSIARRIVGTIEARQRCRDWAAEMAHMITDKMEDGNGSTRLCGYAMMQDNGAMHVEVVLSGYSTETYRRKDFTISQYGNGDDEQRKKIQVEIEERIEQDNEMHRSLGFLPIEPDDEVDLALYTIDLPLLDLMRRTAGAMTSNIVRHVIRTGGILPDDVTRGLADAKIGIKISRGRVKGYFDLAPGVEWRGGRIRLNNVVLPAAARSGVIGMEAGMLLDHRDVSPTMTIGSFQEMKSERGIDTYVRMVGSSVSATRAETIVGDATTGR